MKKLFEIVFLTLIFCSGIYAWDDTGHKVTAEIAWQQMTPMVREKAVSLLAAAPEDSGILNLLPYDTRSLTARQEQMFLLASTWADMIRDERFPVRKQNYHHGTWHYSDVFFRQVDGKVIVIEELKPDAENAVERLFALEKIVRETNKPAGERAVALAWILHIAGDIHQPLHATARVTDAEPKGDQGGNLFLLSPADAPREKRDNLHWFWDSVLSRIEPRSNDEGDSSYIPKLTAKIVQKYSSQKFSNQLKSGKYNDWAQESFEISSRELYPSTLVRGVAPSENYRQKAVTIAEERLALAGYRIADLMNKLFG